MNRGHYRATRRDEVAQRLCNLILNTVATKGYRDTLDRIIRRQIVDDFQAAETALDTPEKPHTHMWRGGLDDAEWRCACGALSVDGRVTYHEPDGNGPHGF